MQIPGNNSPHDPIVAAAIDRLGSRYSFIDQFEESDRRQEDNQSGGKGGES